MIDVPQVLTHLSQLHHTSLNEIIYTNVITRKVALAATDSIPF